MKIFNLLKTVITAFANEPYQHVLAKIWRRVKKSIKPSRIHYNDADAKLTRELKLDQSSSFRTKISFITPVFNPNQEQLRQTLDSVINQTADNWELCLHDDGSSQDIVETLRLYKNKDSRIKLSIGKINKGIVHASNKAIQMAEGQYIAFLDHDDCIHPETVRLISMKIQSNDKIKLIYTNEDSINIKGFVESSFEKLPFGRHTLRSVNYINHLTIIQKEVGDKLGWLQNDYEGAQDYDLLLRVTELLQVDEIAHIPNSLYHWRMTDSSISKHTWAKKYVNESAERALNAHLRRQNTRLQCKSGHKIGTFELVSESRQEEFVLIDIQIESIGEYIATVKSFLMGTSYTNFKIAKGENWDFLKEKIDDALKGYFIAMSDVESTNNAYLICVISESLTFPQPEWLNNLSLTQQIDSNTISIPLITMPNNKILNEGLTYKSGILTDLYKNKSKNSILDYFSGITKDINGIYNICYLCSNVDIKKPKSIVFNSQSEVKLSTIKDKEYGVIIA